MSLLFGAVNGELAEGVLAVARRWRPDLVVHEPLAVAGALAAAALGVPAVLLENSLFDGSELVGATVDGLADARRRHGLPEPPPPAARVTIGPPSVVGGRIGWPMRHLPYSGDGELPDWLREPPGRVRVLVSRSTVGGPGQGGLMSAVVAAAGRVDAEFVLVRPDRRVRRRSLPDNVRAVDWIPLDRALPAATAVIHHGGAGSVLGALAAGLPQLVVPGPGDRRHNAEMVVARRAGLARAGREITPEALGQLISAPALASAAGEVAWEMAAMPTPADLVPRLVALRA